MGKEKKEVSKEIRKANFGKGPRLYVKGVFTGFRRNKVWVNSNQVILKLEGLNDKKEAQYYLGKRVVFIYKTKEGYKKVKQAEEEKNKGKRKSAKKTQDSENILIKEN